MYYVYVLKSLKNSRRYVGYTNDLDRRLEEHNSGFTKSTRFVRPFKLVYKERFKTRLEAIKRERELKSGKGREWLNIIVG